MTNSLTELRVKRLGRVPYMLADELQNSLAAAKRRDREIADYLLMMELEPVVTLGTGGRRDQVLVDLRELRERGIEFLEADRGGGAAYHGPGQLTVYPIMDISRERDLHAYVRGLEAVALGVLDDLGIAGCSSEGLTGVWVGERKIAAIGIRVRGWVTSHGLALNIDPDLAAYDLIAQCGLPDKGVTSIACERGSVPTARVVGDRFIEHFGRIFPARNNNREPWPTAPLPRAAVG